MGYREWIVIGMMWLELVTTSLSRANTLKAEVDLVTNLERRVSAESGLVPTAAAQWLTNLLLEILRLLPMQALAHVLPVL